MEPVVCAPLDPSALTEEDKPVVMKQYEASPQKKCLREKETVSPLRFITI